MVEVTDSLTCLFTAELEADGEGGYTVSVPKREVEHGAVTPGETYRIAVIDRDKQDAAAGRSDSGGDAAGERRATGAGSGRRADPAASGPPVEEGEVREVTIETLGDKGDGIAKIERGYVIIVPDAELGDEVTVEITSVRDNVSFASVITE
jgi:predicted RNA-binding protein with TRAM domain